MDTKNIPVLYADAGGDVLIGMDFLSHFIVTINYPAKEMILLPNETVCLKTNLISTGLKFSKDDQNKTVVKGIWEGSPADKKGIQIGDEILKINSRNLDDLPYLEIKELINNEDEKEVELLVKNDSGERKVVLKKEMILPKIEETNK